MARHSEDDNTLRSRDRAPPTPATPEKKHKNEEKPSRAFLFSSPHLSHGAEIQTVPSSKYLFLKHPRLNTHQQASTVQVQGTSVPWQPRCQDCWETRSSDSSRHGGAAGLHQLVRILPCGHPGHLPRLAKWPGTAKMTTLCVPETVHLRHLQPIQPEKPFKGFPFCLCFGSRCQRAAQETTWFDAYRGCFHHITTARPQIFVPPSSNTHSALPPPRCSRHCQT